MKIYLFIDGTNLYAAQYELFGPQKYLNFTRFIKQIENKLSISFSNIFFYASYTPRKKKMSPTMYKYINNEYLFYRSVKETPRVTFFKGYRSKTSGKEKEVDVKLSVDLVGYGLLNKYNNAFLLTGDADFLQAFLFLSKYKPSIKTQLICLMNKIMYKGLFYYPSTIFIFGNRIIDEKNIAKKAKLVRLNETNLLKSI